MRTTVKYLGTLVIIAILFLTASAFVVNENKDSDDCYIYFYVHDKNDYNKVYASGACHYEGYEKCSQSYNWQPKAEKAFRAYIGANYDVNIDYIYTVGRLDGYRLSTYQQASEKFNEWIAEMKGKGKTIIKTNFIYDCE